MGNTLHTFNAQLGAVRRAVLNGRPHLVAPFVSIVGNRVLNGSKGKLYYPKAEVAANPGVWNHVPITLGHPADPITNLPQSARQPDALNRVQLGIILNDDVENGDRKGEAWFDEELTKNRAPAIYQVLNDAANGKKVRPVELSTGLFTDDIPAQNGRTEDGQDFDFIATNYKPDHLAIFNPGTSRGACNTDQGCGLGVNRASNAGKQETTAMSLNRSFWNWLGGAMGITGNANRHQESGQFLPDGSRISDKQLNAAVHKGWEHVTGQEVPPHDDPDDDGDGGDKPVGRFDRDDGTGDDEANESKLPGAGVTNGGGQSSNVRIDGQLVRGAHSTVQPFAKDETENLDVTGTGAAGSPISVGLGSQPLPSSSGRSTSSTNQTKNAETDMKCPKCGTTMAANGTGMACNCGYKMNLSANAFGMSHGAVHGHVQQALAAKTPQDKPAPQIHEVHDDHAIYHDGSGFQKQTYEPKPDGSGVNLTGKPVPVQQQTSFVPATNKEVDMTLTAKQRKEAEGYLCANCDCYKGQEKVVGNREVMSDELITKLVENTKKRKADEVIANAAKKGFQVAGMTLAFNAAGQIVQNDKAEGSNADATGAVGSSTEANESTEEENGETSEEVTPALKSTKVSDVGSTIAKKTALNRAGLAQLSPELAENMDFLMEGLNAEKRKLATMLVANFADDDPDKKVVFNEYLGKKLKDLRRLAKGLPRYQQPLLNQHLLGRQAASESVYGAPPRLHQPTAPTDNRGDDGDDDLLVCPTINWGRKEEKDEFEESAA